MSAGLALEMYVSSEPRNRFNVTTGAKPPERDRDGATDVGHYFEQGVLDRHASLLAARAATMAMNEELVRLGVDIDPKTGDVTLRRAGKA